MKRLLAAFILFLCAISAVAQDPNPQTSFATTLLYAKPSTYLNFNDFSTSFLDQISGSSFAGTVAAPTAGLMPTPVSTSGNPRVYFVLPAFPSSGNVNTISMQYLATPTAGATVQVLVGNISGTSITITSEPVILTLAATTAVQTFTAGVDFTTFAVTAGQLIGFQVKSGATGIGYVGATGDPSNLWSITSSTIPAIGTPTTYTLGTNTAAFSATVTQATPSVVTPRQPGFDSTQINNTSAEFPWNTYNVAPNNTLGAIDWSSPYTMMVHVDRLNWNRTGTLVLASKGDSLFATNDWWKLYLTMNGTYSQLCFSRNGYAAVGHAGNYICTAGNFDAMPNGYNYNIMVTDNGSGAPGYGGGTTALSLYINGLAVNGSAGATGQLPGGVGSTTYSTGFGAYQITVTGGGTGYAASTAFTVTCPGVAPSITGTISASGGVMTTGTGGVTYTTDYGCTGTPTIALTSPTGTGATFSYTASGASMNSTTLPLLVPGSVNGGITYGIDGYDGTQTDTYVDEFAIFPNVISATSLQDIFYQTKFYQIPSNTVPANRVAFVFDEDGCYDFDNFTAVQEAVAAERLGYLKIEGIVSEPEDGGATFAYRQVLDQAGLSQIPVAAITTGTPGYGGWCSSANITQYNASTPQTYAAYPSDVTVYRQAFVNAWAKDSTVPVIIFTGGPLYGLSDFMQSGADSISPLTGAEMIAQDATNGGAVYMQGGYCTPTSPPNTQTCTGAIGAQGLASAGGGAAAQYVFTHNGALPLIAVAGTPSSVGPGPLSTRTRNDPLFLGATTFGGDTADAYDSLPMARFLSSYFWGGAVVWYSSGGTGYANSTPFTFSGGGTNCVGSGFLTASGGVPNGVEYSWGASQPDNSFFGIGHGCTSAPTVNLIGSTGSGATITAYPTIVCGTEVIAGSGVTWTDTFSSGTCSNHYVEPMSIIAGPPGNVFTVLRAWINSLINPPPNGAPKTP